MKDLAEMARIASSYTARLSPDQVRLCRVGGFIWLRLDVHANLRRNAAPRERSITTNLVFRLSAESPRLLPFTRPFRDLHSETPTQPT